MPQSTEIKNLTIVTSDGSLTFALNDTAGRTLIAALQSALSGKQATLVSGTNIKTINNTSILGSGNITVGSDLSHTGSTTATSGNVSLTFLANQRCSNFITANGDVNLSIECNNTSDNYIWIYNACSSSIDVTIGTITAGGQNLAIPVYIAGDMSVAAGKVIEIGIVRNDNGVFITSRNDLSASNNLQST